MAIRFLSKRTVLLLVLTAVVCVVLGAWQWSRTESAIGVDQNIGYVLLWPLFAGFLIFASVRTRRLEREAMVAHPENCWAAAEAVSRPRPLPGPQSADDIELAAYNRYLADLNARELRHKLRAAGLDISAADR
ncbi:transcriptional regulator [Nocardia amikacinitolerans]|uniref:transcriptional regulator n=1 Tax=Nocardia amikacinitolerans TaxID=756689 RepID=UPI0020A51920|nr:transcriptional regulator [Nocardia amikacinitolerans]MCP2288902.1 DNA-binding transcriptional regulator of glucitol operon [Nocardia amikacinitolerans]